MFYPCFCLMYFLSQTRVALSVFPQVGPAEFNLADNILKLVYSQALVLYVQLKRGEKKVLYSKFLSFCRLGVLFCPLLPAIGFLKSILLFYCRAFAVYFFNKPPRTLFRVASTRNFYMALLLLTTFLCALPVGYAIVEMTPSLTCGPFRYTSLYMRFT